MIRVGASLRIPIGFDSLQDFQIAFIGCLRIASIKGIFEGLYIGTPSTYVLTHTSQGAIGITTRTGKSLDEFRDTILAEPKFIPIGFDSLQDFQIAFIGCLRI